MINVTKTFLPPLAEYVKYLEGVWERCHLTNHGPLVNELEEYNPELLHKQFIIAISKSDMLDEELKKDIEKELPDGIAHIFISSLTNQNIQELKDLLWKVLNEPAS